MLRSTSSRRERSILLALAAAALLLAAAFAAGRALGRGKDLLAEITAGGQRVALLELNAYTAPTRLSMRDLGVEKPVFFELKDHRIRFVDVDCPDKLCEGFGFIGSPGQTAVCMPNRVSVTVIERESA